jgi:hypothetical protein
MENPEETQPGEELTDEERAERGLRILGRMIARRLNQGNRSHQPPTSLSRKDNLPDKEKQ